MVRLLIQCYTLHRCLDRKNETGTHLAGNRVHKKARGINQDPKIFTDL